MENDVLKETAKAVQEVAKFGTSTVGIAEKTGAFVARFIGGTLEQGFGIWTDRFKYARY